jgi:hypothetical protein
MTLTHTGNVPATTYPASGQPYVAGEYSATIKEKWEGREGPGFNAVLKRGKTVVASITQEGQGGQTYASYTSPAERDAFLAYVALWDWTTSYDDFVLEWDEETVLDSLAAEAIELKALNAVRKFQFIPTDGAKGAIYSYKVPASAKGATEIPAILNGHLKAGDKFWNKVEWVTVQ